MTFEDTTWLEVDGVGVADLRIKVRDFFNTIAEKRMQLRVLPAAPSVVGAVAQAPDFYIHQGFEVALPDPATLFRANNRVLDLSFEVTTVNASGVAELPPVFPEWLDFDNATLTLHGKRTSLVHIPFQSLHCFPESSHC